MSEIESIVPEDIETEVERMLSERYDYRDAASLTENTKTTKAKAAAVMVVSGADYGSVAEVLGFSSERVVEVAVQRVLADSLDSWDKAQLKSLFMARFETLFKGALSRSQRKGYPAKEAAAANALKTLVEQVKFAGMATASEHIIHSPAHSQILELVNTLAQQRVSTMPAEVDVIEGHVVREIDAGEGDG